MTTGYGITGIGYPMGLGNYGLGTSGTYGSYDNYMPSMLGMNGMTGMSGMAGMSGMYPSTFGGYGMMGMYNPAFMAQMQNEVEKMQLQHAGDMHSLMTQNNVRAHRESDLEIINKMLTNASVQQGLQNLHSKVREGDQDGICEEFDKLRNQIYHTYKDEIEARGSKENPATAATQMIEALYSAVYKDTAGAPANLRNDIKQYGDGAMMNGFMQGFRPGHHERYIDDTLNYCFGERVDQREAKDTRQAIGKCGGHAANVIEKGLIGTIAGAGSTAIILGTTKACGAKNINCLKGSKVGGLIGAGLGLAYGIYELVRPKAS